MDTSEFLSWLTAYLAHQSAIATIAIFFTAWVLFWLPVAIPLAMVLQWRPPSPLTVEQKLPLVLSLYLLAPFLLWAIAALQGTTFSTYGLGWESSTLLSVIPGLFLGAFGVGVLVALEGVLGWVSWPEQGWQRLLTALPIPLLVGLLVSLIEELVFRGFLLNQLQTSSPLWLAATGSSFIFAVLHLVWEGKEAVPQLPGLWLMGMVLVLARWVDSGNLGLAIGLHAGWIWGIASLDTAQILAYTGRNPEWMTGLSGKPLAGGMGLILLLATAAAIWGMAGLPFIPCQPTIFSL
ncbi:CPBP family intramembrane metalloprotease [Leptothermofonsia sichuanensis E412]|uniref:CPBP family intramembrane glutamic endopeptidase n=1 Tax=Leptothermofonsia sichuanensis TaxID=2917832 RepID=UPI001CA6B09E|nr:type II CAAX endopeptidase family protein [Leptothermofonsia sichuanensis]QZZ21455.1 CPBP family intramembrane metalloprotease [Leptothermofonsia sichuanensis E412]